MLRGNFSNCAALGRCTVLLLAALLFCGAGQAASASERTLSIYNIHTKETTTVVFKRNGKYVQEGLDKLNYALRDWRQNEPTRMDPELIDLLWALHHDLGSKEPIHLISGYRSEKTNNKLRRTVGGQAKKSQHILGKAADIHFPDVPIKTIRNSALVREVGGVGWYPKSGIPFVHVDTGRVRHWPRLPRMELAALFPDGKSQHVPTDGRPITLADARKATQSGKYAGPPEPVMVATVDVKPEDAPAPAAEPIQTASLPARKPATKAPVVTAGLGNDSLGAFMRAAGITGSIEPVAPPAGYKGSAMQLASANPISGIPTSFSSNEELLSAMRTSMPDIEQVAGAGLEPDEEHPEELYYEPVAVLPLMNDTPVSRETGAIAMVAPEYGNTGYLLSEPGRNLALELKPRGGLQQTADASHFTGPAVRNLVVIPETAPDSQPTSREVMTASTPAPSVPMGGPVGYSGGVSMGLR
jgi:uncharacterized protein YcbK (DUF882 family)